MNKPLPKILEDAIAAFEQAVQPLNLDRTQVSLNFCSGKVLSVDMKSNSHWQRLQTEGIRRAGQTPLTKANVSVDEGNVF